MKKVKGVLWIIIIGIFGLVVFQNQSFFLARQSLGIDFHYFGYRTTELPAAVLFAAFFIFGWLLAYLFGLADRYRAKRTIKGLRQTILGQKTAIDNLKRDVDALKTAPPSSAPPAAVQPLETAVDPPRELPDASAVKQDESSPGKE